MHRVNVYSEMSHVRSPAGVGVRTYPLAAVHSGPAESRRTTPHLYDTLLPHLYADDKQIYGANRPSTTAEFQNCVSSCVDDVAAWMQSNRIQLNSAKTEVVCCASSRRQHQIPRSGTRIGADDVMPSDFVRDLGMYNDADVSMRTHVVKTVTISSCFAILYHLRSIRRSVSKWVMQSLVAALVLTPETWV